MVHTIRAFCLISRSCCIFPLSQIAGGIGWSEQQEHLAMQVGQAQALGLPGSIGPQSMMEIDALEALKEPAHGQARRGFAHLVRDSLPSRRQPMAHLPLSQRVDEQT